MSRPLRIIPAHGIQALTGAALMVLLPLLAPGCATLGPPGETLVPTRYQVRTGPFLLYSNTPIPPDSAAIRCLHALENDLTSRLAYSTRPDDEPVEIYVLNDRSSYAHFLRYYYPELPPRRAFFLAQGERRVIYTYLSDRLKDDLRHEATHALLRGCHGDLPLWLDEGLAEYFESREGGGDDDGHLAKLAADLRSGWKPDLRRLEGLSEIHQMTPRDYREAWAWVHLLLDGPQPRSDALRDYLGQNRPPAARPPLSTLLESTGIDAAALVAHLDAEHSRLAARTAEPRPASRNRPLPTEPSSRPLVGSGIAREQPSDSRVIRSQNPARPSLLRRIGMLLGFGT